MKVWDYNLPPNWRPVTDEAWIWYLERKINYEDWADLKKDTIQKYLPRLKLDLGKQLMLQNYFAVYGTN